MTITAPPRKTALYCIAILGSLTSLFGQTSQTQSYDVIAYARLVAENSDEIEGALRAFTDSKERLAEITLLGAAELDLLEATTVVEAAELSIREVRSSVTIRSVKNYLAYLRARRSLGFLREEVQIRLQAEAMSRTRFEEGVKTEDAYFADITARLNTEYAFLKGQKDVESARRILLRSASIDLDTNIEFAETSLPFVSAKFDEEDLLRDIRLASSAYLEAVRGADHKSRRSDALERLAESVTQKERESALFVRDSAFRSLRASEAATEDRSWALLADFDLAIKSVETGEQILAVAESTWEKQQEQHEFGLISDLDLQSAELSHRKSRDQAVRKVEDQFLAYLEIEAAMGSDLDVVLLDHVE